MDKVVFTKDNIDSLLSQLAKEFKRLNGRKLPAEIVLVGGAAIVTQYGFRASTTDIDAVIAASSVMKEAINIVGDRNGLQNGWINQDFMKTSSYSDKIIGFSKHYRTFSNILDVRILPSEYIVAMKLASLRQYKYDMSDIVGIIKSEEIPREIIERAIADLYGSFDNLAHAEDAKTLLGSVYSASNLEDLYNNTRLSETENHVILKELDDKYPEILKQGNISDVLEVAKKRKMNNTP
ncbi:MAG: hypothetical protein J6X48_11635 [Lachnospiraceae bacterium]|nr:hypothetical protein [Lachnospiraceae bacterium]